MLNQTSIFATFSSVFLISFLFLRVYDQLLWEGLSLSFSLLFLALTFQTKENLKSYSYPIAIFAVIAMAMYFPDKITSLGNFETKALIIPLLQVIMFGMGSQISLSDFSAVIKQPKGVLVGLICQFSIMPAIAWILTSLIGFPPEIAAGIILVGASPSGLASNVMSFIANANIALSITLTISATLLTPIVTPFIMSWLAGELIPMDPLAMMNGIIDLIILPIIAGFVFNTFAFKVAGLSSKFRDLLILAALVVAKGITMGLFLALEHQIMLWSVIYDMVIFIILPLLLSMLFIRIPGLDQNKMSRIMVSLSMIGIGLIIAVITANGRDSLLQVGLLLILTCLLHNCLGYFMGYGLCKLLKMDTRTSRTIALEVGMQNGGLASGIAVQMGKITTVGLAAAVFGPLMNITGSSLAIWWKNKKISH